MKQNPKEAPCSFWGSQDKGCQGLGSLGDPSDVGEKTEAAVQNLSEPCPTGRAFCQWSPTGECTIPSRFLGKQTSKIVAIIEQDSNVIQNQDDIQTHRSLHVESCPPCTCSRPPCTPQVPSWCSGMNVHTPTPAQNHASPPHPASP